MGKAKERLAAARMRLQDLYEDDEIGMSAYGAMLIALGEEVPRAHPDCNMQEGWPHEDSEAGVWKDSTGREWYTTRALRDRYGVNWYWAGGFEADPDTQPIVYHREYGEMPLCRAWAVRGPFTQATIGG